MIERPSIGYVASGELGWGTVRRRLGSYLKENIRHVDIYPVEDHAGWEARTPYFRRLAWLRAALAGRRAAQAAIAAGHRDLLVATLHNAPLLPSRSDVRYLVYGDATIGQLDRLYGAEGATAWHKRFRAARLRSLAASGHAFLCMSEWYRAGLRREYGVPDARSVVVPPTVELRDWRRRAYPDRTEAMRVLFVGTDFARKGGDLVLEVAGRPEMAGVRFDLVGGESRGEEGNVVHHGRLDQPTLAARFAESDLFVLPTRADCSPNVFVEAGASGIPSVGTDVGGVSELVRDGETGTIIAHPEVDALAQAIRAYADDRSLLAERGAAAYDWVASRFQTRDAFRPALNLLLTKHPPLVNH